MCLQMFSPSNIIITEAKNNNKFDDNPEIRIKTEYGRELL